MIVKCDQCSTKFKLDDTKIRNEGVKVRCSKCKHIFEVRKETSQDEPDFDSILSGLDSNPPSAQAAVPAPVAAPPQEDDEPQDSFPQVGDGEGVSVSQATDAPHDEFSFDDGATTEFSMGSAPEETKPAADAGDFEFGDFSFGESSDMDTAPAAPTSVAAAPSHGEDDFSFGDFSFGEEPVDSTSQATSVDTPSPTVPEPPQESGDFDFGDFSFSDEPATTTSASSSSDSGEPFDQDATVMLGAKKPVEESDSVDFGDFSFDEPEAAPAAAATRTEATPSAFEATVKLDSFNSAPSDEEVDEPLPSFDFADPGDVQAVSAATPPLPESGNGFSFDEDFGATLASSEEFSFDKTSPSLSPGGTGAAVEPMLVPPDDLSTEKAVAPEPDSFDFGNFDFGDSSPAESSPVAPPLEVRPPVLSSPVAHTVAPDSPAPAVVASSPEDEAPPLPIATRRKGSQSIPYAVLGTCFLVIVAIGGGGYYLYHKGAAAFETLGLGGVAKSLGIEPLEEGAIALKSPAPAFIVNQEAGELFVVTGEAVNNFKKPRASIQIKATLYGPKGEVLQQKTAYCGNVLTKEQLAVMPYPKIEAAMNNQFGDSLANLGVKPGKSIPFVIVLSQVPKNVGEYGLEVVSSTVASQ